MIKCVDGDYEHPRQRMHAIVALTVDQVRACFEGLLIDRAHAIALLRPVHLMKLFPGGPSGVSSYGSGLRRIGRTIVGPTICEVLAKSKASYDMLSTIAKYHTEAEQLEHATDAILKGRACTSRRGVDRATG